MNPTLLAATKAVNRMNVALADLAGALRAAEALQFVRRDPSALGEHAYALEEAAVIAAIVCYARPFVPSNSGNLADRLVDPVAIRMFDGHGRLADLHSEILKSRHEAVAHSDWSRRSTVTSSTALESFWRVKEVEMSQLLPDVEQFIELASHAQDVVLRQMVPLIYLISPTPGR